MTSSLAGWERRAARQPTSLFPGGGRRQYEPRELSPDTDGGTYDLRIAGSRIQANTAKAGGSAIFYVSNTRTGRLYIDGSVSSGNTYVPSGQPTPQSFQNYPGIFYIGNGEPVFTNSTIQ